MKPVVIGNATLYLGDCMEILPTLPKVDAVITDPPYGIGFASQPTMRQRVNGRKARDWDDSTGGDILPLLLLGRTQVVWGGNYYSLPPSRGWLVWLKPGMPPSMADLELAWTNLDRNARHFTHTMAAFRDSGEKVGHPTQKPLALMRWCIERAGNPATILDPFMGAGTTGVAAVEMGASFVGVEREPDYFAMACERIEDAQRQAALIPHERPKQEQQELMP